MDEPAAQSRTLRGREEVEGIQFAIGGEFFGSFGASGDKAADGAVGMAGNEDVNGGVRRGEAIRPEGVADRESAFRHEGGREETCICGLPAGDVNSGNGGRVLREGAPERNHFPILVPHFGGGCWPCLFRLR